MYKEKSTLSYNYSEIPHEIKHPFMESSRRFIHELRVAKIGRDL